MVELPFPDPPLTDELVALRRPRRADAQQRFEAFSDPLCLRFSWPLTETFTEEQVLRRFDYEEQARQHGDELYLAVVNPAEIDEIWGGAALYDVDRTQARAAIGYWLGPTARGRGVATRTLLLLARWAFDHLAIERLELTCAPDNLASRRVAERCGFTHEGTLRSYLWFQGERQDRLLFSLLPSER